MRETSVKRSRKIIFAAAMGFWISFCYVAGKLMAAKTAFRLPHWLCVSILLLCWLPAWLSIFPEATMPG